MIDQSELKEIIKSCVAENGMEFDETQVDDLARALFEDAVKPGKDGISVDDLSDQFRKHKGLLENLTLSIGEDKHTYRRIKSYTIFSVSGKWLVPPKPAPEKKLIEKLKEKIPKFLSKQYFLNNLPFITFLAFIIIVNAILFIQRAVYFKDFTTLSGLTPNPFYLLSRACGKSRLLLLDTVEVNVQ